MHAEDLAVEDEFLRDEDEEDQEINMELQKRKIGKMSMASPSKLISTMKSQKSTKSKGDKS
jgi:hypothetical protein